MSDTGPYTELARAVEAAIITAGLPLTDPHGPTTPNGVVTAGVDVDIVDMRVHGGHWAVMLSWGCTDEAPDETADIMLGAVAQVLRVARFAVERHPVGPAYLVTGRFTLATTAP